MKPSKSAHINYTPLKSEDKGGMELTINARKVPTVLAYGTNSPLGDHVTACRLIEDGLYRRLDFLTKYEVDELHDKKNRDALRVRRQKLYNYISAIAILDPKKSDKLYEAVDAILEAYNKHRHKKTDLKKKVDKLHKTSNTAGLAYHSALEGVESNFRENGEKLRLVFQEISRLVVTFYNKVPLTAFHDIEGFKEGGGDIKVTISRITGVYDWYRGQQNPSSAAIAAKRPKVVKAMNALIHYEEITDPKKLSAHQTENITKKGKSNKPRDNSKETLIKLLARHVHIFFAVYPDLNKIFNKDGELVDDFIDKFIGKGEENVNWPSFANKNDIKEIKAEVKKELVKLADLTKKNHYDKWRGKRLKEDDVQLDSSSDEEISTKPVKQGKPSAKKTTRKLSYSDDEDSKGSSETSDEDSDVKPKASVKAKSSAAKKTTRKSSYSDDEDSKGSSETSDEEDSDAKPKASVKAKSSVKLGKVDELESAKAELAAMKKILEENRAKIPSNVMAQLDKASPPKPANKAAGTGR